MTEKELRKLSRAELLEMLIAQSTELQECKEKLEAAETALKNREIAINNAGSIAEASLMLSGIFEAAEVACQQYTENIRLLSERQETVCAELEAESRAKAQQILSEAEQKSFALDYETKAKCNEMVRKAEAESKQYWDDISGKLDAFYNAHAGLQELLSVVTRPKEQG